MIAQVKDVVCGNTEENHRRNSAGLHHEVLFHRDKVLFCQTIIIIIFIYVREKDIVRLVVILFWSFSRWGATLQ